MITKLAIRNYQSLVSVSLELGQITIITGHSDSGKSALIRAIQRACFNDSGHDFMSLDKDGNAAEKTQVALQTDKNVAVVWERTKSTVFYRLIEGGKEYKFSKLGRNFVPDEIQVALGVRDIVIDPSVPNGTQRIQFAGQFDLPFLVADRGGVATSRLLGRLTGIHVFSQVAKKLVSAKSKLQTTKEFLEKAVADKEIEIEPFETLEEKLFKARKLQNRLLELKKTQTRLLSLQTLKAQLQSTRLNIQRLVDLNLQTKLDVLEGLKTTFQTLWNTLSRLDKLKRVAVYKPKAVVLLPEPAEIPQQLRTSLASLSALKALQAKARTLNTRLIERRSDVHELSNQVLIASLRVEQMEEHFPLCPWKAEFHNQAGTFRCSDLQQVINMSRLTGGK